MFTFDLGNRVKDKVTSFEGVIIARAQYLTGCNQYGVKPTVLKDGVPMETIWFDENRLNLVSLTDLSREITGAGVLGGPQEAPPCD